MIQKINLSQVTHEYEILEEIHPTNFFTFINTGVLGTSDISVEVKYKCPSSFSNDYPRIFGTYSYYNWQSSMCVNYEGNPKKLQFALIGSTNGWDYVSNINPDSNEHIIYLSSSEVRYDNQVLYTTTPTQYYGTDNYMQISIGDNIYNEPSTQGYYNIYYFKIWDNDILIRDMVPVKRLSDNKYGMYDYVNDQFYSSAGNNEYTGTSKSTPEYIDSVGYGTVYANDIKYNGNSIGRIMLDGDVYWGNDITPTPPTPTHLLHGTTTLSGSGIFNIGINNTTYNATKNVPVQYDNGEFWLDELPSSIGTITNLVGMFFDLLHVTSIDQFNLDTSQCRSWWTAFGGASITSFGNISPDLSSCTNLHDTFNRFQGETLDLSRFHVPSTVTNVNGLFYNSPNLKHIDVSNWQLPQLSPQDMWYNMSYNQIVDVTMNNVSEGTFNTFKYALASNSPRQITAKIFRDGVTYVYSDGSWVVE